MELGEILLNPPQLHFSALLPGSRHEQIVTLKSTYRFRSSVKSATCPDVRVRLSLLRSQFSPGEEQNFLKVSIDLTRSLLSPGFSRLEETLDPS